MTVNLSEVGGQLLQWLGLLDVQMDTSKLKERVRTSCCGKPLESRETAIGTLTDLSDVLRQNGFNTEESELQRIIAQKIDELTKGVIAGSVQPKVAQPQPSQGKGEEKTPAAAEQAQALPSNPQERKVALIKHEMQEIDSELKEAEGFDGDDPEIKALRRKHFSDYASELKALLGRVETAAAEAMKQPVAEDTKATATEEKKAAAQDTPAPAPTEKSNSGETPQIEEKKAQSEGQEKAVAQAPAEDLKKVEEKKAQVEEKKAEAKEMVAPQPAHQGPDKELLDEITAREFQISDTQARLSEAEQQKIQGKYIANLRETLRDQQAELAALKAALL